MRPILVQNNYTEIQISCEYQPHKVQRHCRGTHKVYSRKSGYGDNCREYHYEYCEECGKECSHSEKKRRPNKIEDQHYYVKSNPRHFSPYIAFSQEHATAPAAPPIKIYNTVQIIGNTNDGGVAGGFSSILNISRNPGERLMSVLTNPVSNVMTAPAMTQRMSIREISERILEINRLLHDALLLSKKNHLIRII